MTFSASEILCSGSPHKTVKIRGFVRVETVVGALYLALTQREPEEMLLGTAGKDKRCLEIMEIQIRSDYFQHALDAFGAATSLHSIESECVKMQSGTIVAAALYT